MTIGGIDLYAEWGMVPVKRPHVAPPEVKTSYIEVPGGDGVLDYSEVLTGETRYGQRTGSWEFWLKPGKKWPEVYTGILTKLHGKQVRVVLADDPDFYYTGRVEVNEWRSEEMDSRIVLDYNLNPYKYSLLSTAGQDWQWKDLFDVTILYGKFEVTESKSRNLISTSMLEVVPTFTCSAPMRVEFNGNSYSLVEGKNRNGQIALKYGDNIMTFYGTGSVEVEYPFGKNL